MGIFEIISLVSLIITILLLFSLIGHQSKIRKDLEVLNKTLSIAKEDFEDDLDSGSRASLTIDWDLHDKKYYLFKSGLKIKEKTWLRLVKKVYGDLLLSTTHQEENKKTVN